MFPPVDCADENGLLAVGGDLRVATLREAYSSGVFPWPVEGLPLLWFAPPQRAVLFLDELRIGRRLARSLRGSRYEARVDSDFEAVIQSCAAPRNDGEGTWILPHMQEAYLRLHRARGEGIQAHSFETYLEGQLVGGLYGVQIGRYFCGESMFHRAPNASKFALLHLVEYLRGLGASWLDIQMMSPHFEVLGARDVPREQFMVMLRESLGAVGQGAGQTHSEF